MAIEAFRCIGDDGHFCIVRLTVTVAGTLDSDPLLLLTHGAGVEHRFVPADVEGDERSVDFLLPSALRSGPGFALQAGPERLPLAEPAAPDGDPADVGAIGGRIAVEHQDEL